MTHPVNGLHHVTAIASSPQGNLDFYAKVLGLRFVKKTVNFDDPDTYHLYYGDEQGRAGSVMTFFPWMDLPRGRAGTGEVGITQFSVPKGSLDFWARRLEAHGTKPDLRETVLGDDRIVFDDPDGTRLALVERTDDDRAPWLAEGIGEDAAIRGFFGVTLVLHETEPTATILTDLMNYRETHRDGALTRLRSNGDSAAGIVDIIAAPNLSPARQGAGRVHHVAFSVPTIADQSAIREKLAAAGIGVTPQIDRDYFMAIYFRTPGGVLFEIATEEPGFTVDEPLENLGQSLRLPSQHEPLRARLERNLPPLTV
ncbi:ring-cleaving dioxygenase [Breoghania sp. L-A4]|uniref:ring-cleaving dioxygenase n=1 Tax=Breoghania sp. L-A4 TaxID=2304600 RepID=UPI000E359C79|nr:ring-cleaving dioxygenase [Breoghania sp. L-A4]AXS42443.1 ring-cleaving dioxygenase [Breoghania sp. L-A4]